MPVSSAACAVWRRGSASAAPGIRSSRTAHQPVSLGDSQGPFGRLIRRARVTERTAGQPGQQRASTTVTYRITRAAPSSTSRTAPIAPAGSPSARQITPRALRILPAQAVTSASAASPARASPVSPRRACDSVQPVTRLLNVSESSKMAGAPPRGTPRAHSWGILGRRGHPGHQMKPQHNAGSSSASRARAARRSHRSPSPNSPIQIVFRPARAARRDHFSVPQPCAQRAPRLHGSVPAPWPGTGR